MNIGVVTDFYYPWIGGPSTVIRNIGHGLAARGHSISLLAPSASGEPASETDGPMNVTRVRTTRVPFGYNLRTGLWPRREVDAWIDAVKPDVVHIHHPFPLSATAAWSARKRGIPVAATNHTIPQCSLWGLREKPLVYRPAEAIFGRWIVELLQRCQCVATPTRWAAEALTEMGYMRHVRAISNGIDIERFSPGPPPSELRAQLRLDDRPIVLYTGRLDAEKEMDVWIEAARNVRARLDVQFVIGGNGSERSRLQGLVHSMGTSADVHFVGYLSEDDFPAIYRLADVYCVTSRVELQSIATLEAIASGLPVVAVRGGALPELVHQGDNGLLARAGDAVEVAAGLTALLENPAQREKMGEQSRTIAQGHRLEASVAAYDDFLTAASRGRIAA